ncbi:hypothetical protein FA95DRAFT_1582635 [Auriscalpium vulgare]|uniref:Uncharacterized protein n=1 Tax=Auriscalpium vulgare TaxID=40419 RepID=A0ACB8RTX1_9AGAM|nr:hypothetical protein FA95DRAFT_1582635 [Auriscalpium vulgare]
MAEPRFQILHRGGDMRGRGFTGRGGWPGRGRGGPCRYWASDSCRRGSTCPFKHEQPHIEAGPSEPIENAHPPPDVPSTGSPSSDQPLMPSPGSPISDQHALIHPLAVAALNALKPHLQDDDFAHRPMRVEAFSKIFARVDDSEGWFLDAVVNEALRFKPVSVDACGNRKVLSFQRGYFPLLQYLASDALLKSTMHNNVNAIYKLVDENYDAIHATTIASLGEMTRSRTWDDKNAPASKQDHSLNGAVVFKTLATVLIKLLSTFRTVIWNHPRIKDFVQVLSSSFRQWSLAVRETPALFKDTITSSEPAVRTLTIETVENIIQKLEHIADREFKRAERLRRPARPTHSQPKITAEQAQQARMSVLEQMYDPPGELREDGPRHDNDFADIASIRIAPTHGELMSTADPYIPAFLPDAPHHLPPRSPERLLDIQFRLLREESTSPMRRSLSVLRAELLNFWRPMIGEETKLEAVLRQEGGAYRQKGENPVFFHVYTGVEFHSVKAERRGITICLRIDTPPGLARDRNATRRSEHWLHSKRLQQGNLVALVLASPAGDRMFLGTVMSTRRDITESSSSDAGDEKLQLRVAFFDTEVELLALRRESPFPEAPGMAILLDNNTMFDATRPFLEVLQNMVPESLPFAKWLTHGRKWPASMSIPPPSYASAPGFAFNMRCSSFGKHEIPNFDVNDLGSEAAVHEALRLAGALDPSQVDVLINALKRKLALVKGPPGAGKRCSPDWCVVFLLLRAYRILNLVPIVLVSHTNHALDRMLESVLDEGITTKLVRLGNPNKFSTERMRSYSLENRERQGRGDNLHSILHRETNSVEKIQKDLNGLMASIRSPHISSESLMGYLRRRHPEHADDLDNPPARISAHIQRLSDDEAENARSGSKSQIDDQTYAGSYGFWKSSRDIGSGSTHRYVNILAPKGHFGAVWSMSKEERRMLANCWEDELRKETHDDNMRNYEYLRRLHAEARERCDQVQNEHPLTTLRRQLDTAATSGHGRGIAPKVVMVEEAGQVLEAHTLAALVPSVEHLICIGDPDQLRPNLTTFALSMDNPQGRQFYKFDCSLMEWLADLSFPMSQMDASGHADALEPFLTHRSRKIMYPTLKDHPLVLDYPRVDGMGKNVFFFSHNHPENSEADSVSKYNTFEVDMIRDLVMHLLKQEPYNESGDIAVLCAYLGQLHKVRAALRHLEIAVKVDEKDEEELERQGLDSVDTEDGFSQVRVLQQVRLATLDNSQGEEAKIVILSTVRNSGTLERGRSHIGFLESKNRINVALSRAKHGLFILGNATNLRQNATWEVVLNELERKGQVGAGFPIECPRHPSNAVLVSKPGELASHAPDGGCRERCNVVLPQCGHTCSSVCHADTNNHRKMDCDRDCKHICPRGHPCPRRCSETCGDCQVFVGRRILPCDHVSENVPCYLQDRLEDVACLVKVPKELPRCGHRSMIPCHEDVDTARCTRPCGGILSCCSRECKSSCYECQDETNRSAIPTHEDQGQTRHLKHHCERVLEACSQKCGHRVCAKYCSELCPPQTCVAAGCLPPDRRADIVDLIEHRTLEQIDYSLDGVSQRLITLGCGHIFTVQSLDGHCRMADYYEIADSDGSYLRTKAPPVDYQPPPLCPTCREPVTALRYGRITKRAALDLLEQHTASKMSADLEKAGGDIQVLIANARNLQAAARRMAFTPAEPGSEEAKPAISGVHHGTDSTPLPFSMIEQGMMAKLHGLAPQEARTWKVNVRNILKAYKKVVEVASVRGPHLDAYDAAFADLQRIESTAISADASRACAVPAPVAMADARRKLGQPPYKADTRLQVEAFVMSFEVRFLLAEIAKSRIEGLVRIADTSTEALQSGTETWRRFVGFLYTSCVGDASKARAIAEAGSASRQAARAAAYGIRAEVERSRFEVLCEHEDLQSTGTLTDAGRESLGDRLRAKEAHAASSILKTEQSYVRSRPVQTTDDMKEERAWFKETCGTKVARSLDELHKLTQAILTGMSYSPVSLQEKEDIVRALSFSHRGHWYKCPKGHPYVITECGGADQAATCPECGASIGGTGHDLESTNSRAMELERIAGQQGSQDPHWQWGHGA